MKLFASIYTHLSIFSLSSLLVLLVMCPGGMAMSDEKRLIKHLLDQYTALGRIGRPVINTSHTVQVYYGMSLIQILDLDQKNQILTTNVWSRYVSSLLILNLI